MKSGNKLLEGTPEKLLNEFKNKVWNCIVYDKYELEILSKNYCIVNMHQENNHTELRIVSNTKPNSNATNALPNLEDLYLAYFQDSEGR